MSFHSITFPILKSSPGVILSIQALPVSDTTESKDVYLLAINEESILWKLALHTGEVEKLLQIHIEDLNLQHPIQIVVSPNGKYAAISNRCGLYGALVDLHKREQINNIELKRDGYHSDVSVYPLAFTEIHGRTLLIHGTKWNRLDLIDVSTGENLSERPSPSYNSETTTRDEHYLEYFHGQLHVSPDGKRVAETGWIWHPVAEVRS